MPVQIYKRRAFAASRQTPRCIASDERTEDNRGCLKGHAGETAGDDRLLRPQTQFGLHQRPPPSRLRDGSYKPETLHRVSARSGQTLRESIPPWLPVKGRCIEHNPVDEASTGLPIISLQRHVDYQLSPDKKSNNLKLISYSIRLPLLSRNVSAFIDKARFQRLPLSGFQSGATS